MFNIIGGSYFENCKEPNRRDFFGSGIRGAAVLSNKGIDILFYSCVSEKHISTAKYSSKLFGYNYKYLLVPETIEFDYYHPLSKPFIINYDKNKPINEIIIDNESDFLYYGMLEANAKINGNYVVYDPQNHRSFKDTGSTAKHLAIILNKKEAHLLAKTNSKDLRRVGNKLLESENAEVVVIKNGSSGALVFHGDNIQEIPVFRTDRVWPIGSGDVFTAIFSWQWIIEKKNPFESALYSSMQTACFCQSNILPIVEPLVSLKPIEIKKSVKRVYLAGPFYTLSERWLINQLRNSLIDFGNKVFSPLHDVGIIDPSDIYTESKDISEKDLAGLDKCDVVLAVFSGMDAGTLFEIGYAISKNKKVVILSENVNNNDLTMFIGTGCEITDDFTTAIYKTSW
ncbi:MAG: PfkB family carbohydrate kinase [Fermentimonas sp.]|nr:PfkB family carbohydrate kinase [Fermentimonas sp.]